VQQVQDRKTLGRLLVFGRQDNVVLELAADGLAVELDGADREGLAQRVRGQDEQQGPAGQEREQGAVHGGSPGKELVEAGDDTVGRSYMGGGDGKQAGFRR
jgi:hypothetical protein